MIALLVLVTLCLSAASESLFALRPTWEETMLATREAVLARSRDTTFTPYRSGVLRGGEEPVRIDIDITGAQQICLEATIGGDVYNYDQAIWGEPEVVKPDGTRVRLTRLKPAAVSVGWGELLRDKNHQDQPLSVAGQAFAFGFWAHGPSRLVFRLDGEYVRFTGYVGIDSAAGDNGSAEFVVGPGGDDALQSVWTEMKEAFPIECALYAEAMGEGRHLEWFSAQDSVVHPKQAMEAAKTKHEIANLRRQLQLLSHDAVRRAVEDLGEAFPGDISVPEVPAKLDAEHSENNIEGWIGDATNYLRLVRQAFLQSSLVDFDEILIVRRSIDSPSLGLPCNWQGNCSLPRNDYVNDIAVLSQFDHAPRLLSICGHDPGRFVGDVDLHFDGERMLFSMPDERGRFQIWEMNIDGSGLRQVTLGEEADVDNYDACYLPDECIIYGSTACYVGIPCVFGGDAVANLHIMNPDGTGSRQLCVDQDHNWCPTLLNNGRVLYSRWEYADLPHSNTRILFHMNPDGTNQAEYMHSNSYWPNGVFYAKAIPNHPTKVVGIVTGHHGVRRMGELVVFDPALGRGENDGAIVRLPHVDEAIEPEIKDQLVDDSWPKFLHPYPLSEKHFLVSCQPTPDALWGIYYADTFGNLILLAEEPGSALFEPIPIRKTPRPPVIPDRIDTKRKDAVVYMANVYEGPGLDGIPEGTVKALRVFTYTFSHRGTGGLLGTIGMDGPWDIKRVLGTVPVEPDGSALFRVPASTPIAVHPLDAEGKSLQHMRSWFTGMPGEVVSCVGCHEQQSTPPPPRESLAVRREPSEIDAWYGPARGFSFAREVQPVLDRHCAGCHDGDTPPDLRGTEMITDWSSAISGHADPSYGGKFSLAYAELHRYVRRPGIESDNHLLSPMDFHADTTELMQILNKGHYEVALDNESRDRLVTWIDLNAPYHGAWSEIMGAEVIAPVAARRRELRQKYTGMDDDTEWLPPMPLPATSQALGPRVNEPVLALQREGWPLAEAEAKALQAEAGATTRTVDLGEGITLDLVWVPAGEFVMGSADGHPDERPQSVVTIDSPFWMAATEITNAQYALFDPTHDSRVESKHGYQFGVHGYPLNEPDQPVVRVSWEQAQAFCAWLGERAGDDFRLPTEAEWEYACRAGSDATFSFGALGSDFAPHANLGDIQLARFASDPYTLDVALPNPNKYDDWIPRDTQFDDGGFVSMPVGSYQPNAWGLHDMHGNVWEWTLSASRPYPYNATDGRNEIGPQEKRVVRGGSWYDRPLRGTVSYRGAYVAWQRVFNVGFRVVCPAGKPIIASAHKQGAN
jgi:formylglycine-generating enzyme required for sulfatase activity